MMIRGGLAVGEINEFYYIWSLEELAQLLLYLLTCRSLLLMPALPLPFPFPLTGFLWLLFMFLEPIMNWSALSSLMESSSILPDLSEETMEVFLRFSCLNLEYRESTGLC